MLEKGGLLDTVLEMAEKHYAKEVDPEKLVQGVLNGALRTLDDYSVYYTASDYKLFQEHLQGEFGGIGVEVKSRREGLEIIAPIEGGPAHRMGLRAGDIIVTLDGIAVPTLMPVEIIKHIHGKPKTSVRLGYIRPSEANFSGKDVHEILVVREIIQARPIQGELIGKIAYFRLSMFSPQSAKNLGDIIEKMQRKLMDEEGKSEKFQGVILDLRDNPGGTLDEAIAVTSLFLKSGIIVRVESRDRSLNKIFKSTGPDMFKNIPVVVLINRGSASASEVLSGALRDHKRAVLLGQKSYGKGSVQHVFDLEKKGAVSLTVAYFKTPEGSPINGVGLIPDILVDQKSLSLQKNDPGKAPTEDTQKQRAIDLLKGLSALHMG